MSVIGRALVCAGIHKHGHEHGQEARTYTLLHTLRSNVGCDVPHCYRLSPVPVLTSVVTKVHRGKTPHSLFLTVVMIAVSCSPGSAPLTSSTSWLGPQRHTPTPPVPSRSHATSTTPPTDSSSAGVGVAGVAAAAAAEAEAARGAYCDLLLLRHLKCWGAARDWQWLLLHDVAAAAVGAVCLLEALQALLCGCNARCCGSCSAA
jgi:hypothetical protein